MAYYIILSFDITNLNRNRKKEKIKSQMTVITLLTCPKNT